MQPAVHHDVRLLMTQRTWRDLGLLALAAVPLLLVAYASSLSVSEVRHTPIEAARVFRALLFLGIASALFAGGFAIRRWLGARTNLLAIAAVVAAIAFLVWALPLAWGVLGAIVLHGDL
jgi:hypothetical protein